MPKVRRLFIPNTSLPDEVEELTAANFTSNVLTPKTLDVSGDVLEIDPEGSFSLNYASGYDISRTWTVRLKNPYGAKYACLRCTHTADARGDLSVRMAVNGVAKWSHTYHDIAGTYTFQVIVRDGDTLTWTSTRVGGHGPTSSLSVSAIIFANSDPFIQVAYWQ